MKARMLLELLPMLLALLTPSPISVSSFAFSRAAATRSLSSLKKTKQERTITRSTVVRNMSSSKNLAVDPFCFRQFAEHEASKNYKGAIFSNSIKEFEEIVNARYDEANLKDGYAPFCKHIFVKNDFTNAKVNVLEITPENQHLLRSTYDARSEQELPVLVRWFPKELVKDDDLPVAQYLDLILYSRDQINKENASMGQDKNPETAPWGIVSIKAQDVDYELPMTPITAMRNALGKDEGGSGVPLDREKYLEAVAYWDKHANVS